MYPICHVLTLYSKHQYTAGVVIASGKTVDGIFLQTVYSTFMTKLTLPPMGCCSLFIGDCVLSALLFCGSSYILQPQNIFISSRCTVLGRLVSISLQFQFLLP